MIELITPIGISVEGSIILEIISHIIKKLPPKKKDPQNMFLLFAPTNNLTTWGMISPTKHIGPVKLTIAPMISDDEKIKIK